MRGGYRLGSLNNERTLAGVCKPGWATAWTRVRRDDFVFEPLGFVATASRFFDAGRGAAACAVARPPGSSPQRRSASPEARVTPGVS